MSGAAPDSHLSAAEKPVEPEGCIKNFLTSVIGCTLGLTALGGWIDWETEGDSLPWGTLIGMALGILLGFGVFVAGEIKKRRT